MYVPFDAERGIHPQDDSFLEKDVWDFAATPIDRYPLLLHYHPLVIYRHQVIKQADVVLAMFLLGDEFPIEQKRRNFDYYDPLTTGDSSLSACVQSIMAAEIGYEALAEEYFQYALLMDLADVNGERRRRRPHRLDRGRLDGADLRLRWDARPRRRAALRPAAARRRWGGSRSRCGSVGGRCG
jgi:trehalose/maltose hydrolase-like predicted phosphorylase